MIKLHLLAAYLTKCNDTVVFVFFDHFDIMMCHPKMDIWMLAASPAKKIM